jgi:hypothetical protein
MLAREGIGSQISLNVDQLLQMSQSQLDALYSSSPPGPIPDREAQGTAIIAPGTRFSSELAEFVSVFGWKGKTFDAKERSHQPDNVPGPQCDHRQDLPGAQSI